MSTNKCDDEAEFIRLMKFSVNISLFENVLRQSRKSATSYPPMLRKLPSRHPDCYNYAQIKITSRQIN